MGNQIIAGNLKDFTENKDSVYEVNKANPTWIVSVKTTSTIRLHTSPSHAPFMDFSIVPPNTLSVNPGQWCELWRNQLWYLMSDADYR